MIMPVTVINNQQEAWNFCNKLMSAITKPDAKPIQIEYEFAKKRTLPQNDYYHGVVLTEIVKFYQGNLAALYRDFIVLNKVAPSRDFIHEFLKQAFNNGKSTTKLDKQVFFDTFITPIREYYLHENKLLIDEPPVTELTHKE